MNTKQSKIAVLAILTLMIGMNVMSMAQSRFGIRGGLNASNVSFDNLPNRSERFSYHLGFFADVPVLSNFMSMQPELSYSVKGAAFEYLNERRKLNLQYVDFLLPVAFHLSSIDIQVGPFASFLASTPDYTVFDENRVVIDAFKKYDVGLTAGLSYNFNNFLFGIRYNQGFVDVTKDSSRPLLGSGKNAVGQASIGYKF
ncbi:MAG: porin family protein [Saprospiraceae bacterium]|nr:porin family protein [Saprospiraceae bacterium]